MWTPRAPLLRTAIWAAILALTVAGPPPNAERRTPRSAVVAAASAVSIPKSHHGDHRAAQVEPPQCDSFDNCVMHTGDMDRCIDGPMRRNVQAAGLCVKAACIRRAESCKHVKQKEKDKYCEVCYAVAHHDAARGGGGQPAGSKAALGAAGTQGQGTPSMLPLPQGVPKAPRWPSMPPGGFPFGMPKGLSSSQDRGQLKGDMISHATRVAKAHEEHVRGTMQRVQEKMQEVKSKMPQFPGGWPGAGKVMGGWGPKPNRRVEM